MLQAHLISILDHHVSAADEIEVIFGEEVLNDGFAETVADSSLIVFPVKGRVTRIAPEEIIKKAVVGHVGRTRYSSDVVHSRKRRRQSAVDTEDLASYKCRDRQTVKDVHKRLPHFDVTASLAFIVKSVYCSRDEDSAQSSAVLQTLLLTSCYVRTLVIAPKEEEVFGVFDLVAEQEQDSLQALLTAVDIVAEEKVVCFRWEAAHLE